MVCSYYINFRKITTYKITIININIYTGYYIMVMIRKVMIIIIGAHDVRIFIINQSQIGLYLRLKQEIITMNIFG